MRTLLFAFCALVAVSLACDAAAPPARPLWKANALGGARAQPDVYAALHLPSRAFMVYAYDQNRKTPVEELGPFSGPSLLATDRQGNLYVADLDANAIDVFAPNQTMPFKVINLPMYTSNVAAFARDTAGDFGSRTAASARVATPPSSPRSAPRALSRSTSTCALSAIPVLRWIPTATSSPQAFSENALARRPIVR